MESPSESTGNSPLFQMDLYIACMRQEKKTLLVLTVVKFKTADKNTSLWAKKYEAQNLSVMMYFTIPDPVFRI